MKHLRNLIYKILLRCEHDWEYVGVDEYLCRQCLVSANAPKWFFALMLFILYTVVPLYLLAIAVALISLVVESI